jgi:hypothetical protein
MTGLALTFNMPGLPSLPVHFDHAGSFVLDLTVTPLLISGPVQATWPVNTLCATLAYILPIPKHQHKFAHLHIQSPKPNQTPQNKSGTK